MSALPFDGPHDDAIVECVRLASAEQLGRDLARRAAQAVDLAENCWQRARRENVDMVTAASLAESAEAAAAWCGRYAAAVGALLGQGDVETTRVCWEHARMANRHAANAAACWLRVKTERGEVAHA